MQDLELSSSLMLIIADVSGRVSGSEIAVAVKGATRLGLSQRLDRHNHYQVAQEICNTAAEHTLLLKPNRAQGAA